MTFLRAERSWRSLSRSLKTFEDEGEDGDGESEEADEDLVEELGELGESSSRRDVRVSSCFFCRAASSAATREAMCSSRDFEREELV